MTERCLRGSIDFMIRVAIVSNIRPETNYSAYLIESLQKNYSSEVLVYSYCEKEKENEFVKLDNKRYCWDRNWRYFFQIILQAKKDEVEILHFQHEINMFGGPRTAVLFPLLVFLSRIFGFKPVVTLHAAVPVGSFNEEFLKVFQWPRPKLLAPMVKIIFPTIYFLIGFFAKKIIVHSPGIKETLVRDYRIARNKIAVIPHGVPEDIGYQLTAVGSQLKSKTEGKKFILYFGYLHRRKGIEYLIEAFEKVSDKYPDLILILAGGTVLANYALELKAQIDSLDLAEKIIITGFIKLPELRYLLENCQFVVLPAIYSIAASGPLAQAFAHGKAVLVSDLGVYREEIQDGVNGLLAKVGDVEDLFRQMDRLLVDEVLKTSLQKSVGRILEERSWPKIAEKTLQIYQGLKK